jgi:hypothetical protein
MSKNVINAIVESTLSDDVGMIPSRRQIDMPNGYVNGWSTREFLSYTSRQGIIRCRDHAGPLQGAFADDGLDSISQDCTLPHSFQIIHIDPWKKAKSIENAAELTSSLIKHCDSLNSNVAFEVGTEQGIRPYTDNEMREFLSLLENHLGRLFHKIVYCVVQGGTLLQGTENLETLNEDRLNSMVRICNNFGLLSKEHNGDYLTSDQVTKRFQIGLDSINIAPEFGQLETSLILDRISEDDIEKFFEICFNSMKWVKWLPNDFVVRSQDDKLKVIRVSGHYNFSTNEMTNIKMSSGIQDSFLVDMHKDHIQKILKSIKCLRNEKNS